MAWATTGFAPDASGWSLPRERLQAYQRLVGLSQRSPGLSRRARRRRRGQRKATLRALRRS